MKYLSLDVRALNRIAAPYHIPLDNGGLVLVEGENRDGGVQASSNGSGKSI